MYAKIINQETKEVSVGLGTNTNFYKSIGMVEMETEQAYNGAWYVKGYAPAEPEEHKKAKRRAELIAELNALDLKAVRPLRALSAGTGTNEDKEFLEQLEQQAEAKRAELKELGE